MSSTKSTRLEVALSATRPGFSAPALVSLPFAVGRMIVKVVPSPGWLSI
jgi:hypothetical protein